MMVEKALRAGAVAGALVVLGFSAARAAAPAPPAMTGETRAMLESVLSAEQLAAAWKVLGAPEAWGSLGPNPPGVERAPLPHRPGRVETMPLPEAGGAAGSGTAEDPWTGVISAFLARFEYEPGGIRVGQHSYPDEERLAARLGQLAYEPVVIRVPAGHYREVSLAVPPAVWLEAAGEVVLGPDMTVTESRSLVHLHIAAGLLGFTLDGADIPEFIPEPPLRITAVRVEHRAVIAGNHIRRFTGHGLVGAGSRCREGALATVRDNIIEYIGYSGIRHGSRWEISDNQVRYAGLLRPGGGGGDDGIIPAWSVESRIVNNLVILGRRPHGRHVISGQTANENLYAGNISVSEGSMRNNIGLSDGSHRNRLVGNLILGTGGSTRRIHAGISASGYGNIIEYNVSLGNPRGFRARGRDGEGRVPSVIRRNYAEYTLSAIHRSSFYEAEDNEIIRDRRGLPLLAPHEFGFFGGVAAALPVIEAPGGDTDDDDDDDDDDEEEEA